MNCHPGRQLIPAKSHARARRRSQARRPGAAVEAAQRDGPLQLCAVGVVREARVGHGLPGDGDQLAD